MVKYGSIVKIMEEYVTKCRTIAEIENLLSGMSQAERYSELLKTGLLNGGELKYYKYLYRVLNYQRECLPKHLQELDDIENGRIDSGFSGYLGSDKHKEFVKNEIRWTEDLIAESEKEIFKYERRLFDGTKPRTPQTVPYRLSDYATEKQVDGDVVDNPIGELEQAQIEYQKKTLDLTETEVNALIDYYGSGGKEWNSYIHNGARWKYNSESARRELKPRYEESMVNLSNAINKTEGLLENTMVFHGGQFDISKIVGDEITLKSYTSCSFQRNIARHSIKEYEGTDELMYTYKLLLPKGYKGLCANDDSHGKLSNYAYENEILLDRNFKGKIVDIDYSSQTVTIIPSD